MPIYLSINLIGLDTALVINIEYLTQNIKRPQRKMNKYI